MIDIKKAFKYNKKVIKHYKDKIEKREIDESFKKRRGTIKTIFE